MKYVLLSGVAFAVFASVVVGQGGLGTVFCDNGCESAAAFWRQYPPGANGLRPIPKRFHAQKLLGTELINCTKTWKISNPNTSFGLVGAVSRTCYEMELPEAFVCGNNGNPLPTGDYAVQVEENPQVLIDGAHTDIECMEQANGTDGFCSPPGGEE